MMRKFDLLQILENPSTIGVYTPLVDDQTHEYGIPAKWEVWAECKSWSVDSALTGYSPDTGINPHTTMTVYIAGTGRSDKNNEPLPSRVGIKFNEKDTSLSPSQSVENFYDFDGQYVYSVVVV